MMPLVSLQLVQSLLWQGHIELCQLAPENGLCASLHLDICRQSELTGGCEALMGEWTLLDCELVPSKTWGFHCVDIRPLESHPGESHGRLQCHAENTPDGEQRHTSNMCTLDGCKFAL